MWECDYLSPSDSPGGEIELLLTMFVRNDGNLIKSTGREGEMKERINKPSANRGSCLWEQHKMFSTLAFLLVLENTNIKNIKIMIITFYNIITEDIKSLHTIITAVFLWCNKMKQRQIKSELLHH